MPRNKSKSSLFVSRMVEVLGNEVPLIEFFYRMY